MRCWYGAGAVAVPEMLWLLVWCFDCCFGAVTIAMHVLLWLLVCGAVNVGVALWMLHCMWCLTVGMVMLTLVVVWLLLYLLCCGC